MQISLAIADRAAREEDVASAKQVIARLTSAVERAEKKRSLACTSVEFERAELVGRICPWLGADAGHVWV
jgi:uncharacterized protein CbrC (UPF0167 family)